MSIEAVADRGIIHPGITTKIQLKDMALVSGVVLKNEVWERRSHNK